MGKIQIMKQGEIEKATVAVADLKPHPRNPKKHFVSGIEDSMQKRGYVDPIVVDENNVILAGHGRLEAMKKIGYESVDVIVKRGPVVRDRQRGQLQCERLYF